MIDIYRSAIRPFLFSGLKADPEWLHERALSLVSWLESQGEYAPGQLLQSQLYRSLALEDSRLQQSLWGINFPNPVGLAAGFDKDGVAAGIWHLLGFGFAELGTVTLHPQPGNPQPRLFRLKADQAILNRMGFNNQGAAALAVGLQNRLWRGVKGESLQRCPIPLGINLGKSKVTPLAEAVSDYVGSFQVLQGLGDYFVVNVSSPNTPGLRQLQDADQLAPILAALRCENQGQKPMLIKIAPDLEWEAISQVIELAQRYQLAGIIATNTTIRREGLQTGMLPQTGKSVMEEAGGISGVPLRSRSTEVIRFIYRQTQGQLPIIGVGGIFTAADAWEKITAGASLVQLYTGWIYEGPWGIRRILSGLLDKLEERGFSTVAEAVGTESV